MKHFGKPREAADGIGPLLGAVCAVPAGRIRIGDERWRITTGEPSDALRDSLRAWGCLSPPICLDEADGGLVPVAGFKRLAAWMDVAGSEGPIEVRILEGLEDPLRILTAAARDIRRERALTPFEAARAIRCAIRSGLGREDVSRRLLPELGLEPHATVVKRYLELESVPPALVELLEPQGVSLRRALKMARVEPEDGALLAAIGRGLHLSLRALEECAQMLSDVARRDSRSWPEVADEAGLLSAMEAEGRVDDRARSALKALFGLRYPTWHAASERVGRRAESVSPPEGVRLRWDERFEEEGLEVAVKARTVSELRERLAALMAPERLSRLEDLFEAL